MNKHLVQFWMSTEDVERTFIDPEEITQKQMELGGKYSSHKKKHLVRFWMSTEKVARGC